jgi:hypothetical protein
MFAGFFRSNRPAVLLVVPLVVVGVFLPLAWSPRPVLTGRHMPLTTAVLDLAGGGPVAQGVIGMVLITLISIQLAFLANEADLLGRRTHLPAILLPALLGAMGHVQPLDPALLGMPLVLWALRRTLSIAQAANGMSALFDAGLLLGLAALFYVPYAFLVVVVWASVSVIRPFQWREYVLPFVGSFLVFFLAWCTLHLLDKTPWYPLRTVMPQGLVTAATSWPRWHSTLLMATLVPLLLVAMVRHAQAYQRGVMREKNLRASFMAFLAGSGVLIVLVHTLTGSFPVILAAAPLAVLASHTLLGTRRAWLSELAIAALLLLALRMQWAG